jgi:hypothetical protein
VFDMNTVGVERRWARTSKLGARFGWRGPLLALSACVVFGGSFAISRASHSGAAVHVESAPSLPVAFVTGTIPASLASAEPIASSLEPPAPPPPRPSPKAASPSPAVTSVAPSLPEAPAASAPSPQPSAPAPAPERAAPAPAPEARAPSHSSGGGGGHAPSSSGTFESSG